MADDFLNQALAQIAQQSLAQNPYAQFGSVLSQQKNPYITAEDPWSGVAASAAQGFLGGLSSGYGQAQVGQQMQQIAPLVPELFNNPMGVQNPGIDPDVFSNLQIAAQNQAAARAAKLNDLITAETIKQGLNPQAPLFDIQARREKMKLDQELRALYGAGGAPSEQASMMPMQGQVPAFEQVLKGPPAAPTQREQGAMGQAVPSLESLKQKYLRQLPYDQALEAANKEYQDALTFNRQLAMEGVKEQVALNKMKAEQDVELQKQGKEADKGFDTTVQAIQQMGLALKDLPNYAGISGGFEKFVDEQKAAYLTKGSKKQKQAAKGASAFDMISGSVPLAIGDLRKELFPGSTSNFEVGILLKPFPEGTKLSETNAALFGNVQKAANVRIVERQFKNLGRSQGLSEKQIQNMYEQARAKMGGTFLDSNNELKPEFKVLATRVGASLI